MYRFVWIIFILFKCNKSILWAYILTDRYEHIRNNGQFQTTRQKIHKLLYNCYIDYKYYTFNQ